MKQTITKLALTVLSLGVLACSDSDDAPGPNRGGASEPQELTLTPIGQLNRGADEINSHADVTAQSSVKMNYRSYINLGQSVTGNDNPNYARIKKLSDGSYILFNHYGGQGNANGFDIYYATSPDLENWTGRGLFLERYVITNSRGNSDKRVFTNPNAIVLSNGDLVAFASYRANMSVKYEECQYDHGIVMLRSMDNGRTWSAPQEIYHGLNWEPHMIQLPSGELQCYFSESRLWISGGHSGTAMVVSTDNGVTWSPGLNQTPYRVIRQHWYNSDKGATLYTDQMPVVVRLNGSDKLAAALESSVSCVNDKTTHTISFAYSDNEGQWPRLEGDETGPADRQSNLFDGSAPFLVQFPSGETLLSYGASSHMNMRLGDAEARTFGEPFVALPGRGSWGCMELNGGHEVIAAMRNSEKSGDITIALARFELNHRITATRRTVGIDGDNAEWAATDDALFVGEKSQAQATLRCSCDDKNVYFLVEVLDEAISRDDYVNILLSPANEGDRLTSAARRIKVSHSGLKSTDVYAEGWRETDMGVTVQAAYDGTISDSSDTDNGYLVEVAVPRSQLDLASGEILVNLVLFDSQGGEDAICPTSSRSIAGWVPIAGL